MIINQSLKLSALILAVALSSCAKKYVPQTGDIAFQVSANSDFVKAITDVSAQDDPIKFAHVGIVVAGYNDSYMILEAVPKGGVKLTSMEEFLADADSINGAPGVVIKRVNCEFPVDKAVKKAFTFIGQKYDWKSLPDNGKMYCSELVYESFKDAEGHPLFHSAPMNYYDAEGNIPQYWIDLFKKLGTDIPQGIEGTSPQGMSQEESLTEVYRYFR